MSQSITSDSQTETARNLPTRLSQGPWPELGLGLLALILRVINLSGRPLWYDEAFAVLYAEKPFATMLYGTVTQVQGAAADVHPLFFYSILHAWMKLVGQNPAAVRALSVLLGLTTVLMIYLLARRLFDRWVGLAAGLIAAIAPFHVYYSQEARMYALLGLAAVTAVYFFVRGWDGGGWGNWLAFAVFGAMTLYAHNLGFAFLLGLDLWVLWTWLRPGGERWRHLWAVLLSQLLMLALFAPWLMVLPSQLGKIEQAYWVQRPGLAEILQTLLVFHFAYDNQALPRWLVPAALFFSILIPVVLVMEVVRSRRSRSSRAGHEPAFAGAWALLLFLTLIPLLFTFLVSQIRPVYIVRAMLPAALIYYIVVAAVLVRGETPRPVKWGLGLASAALIVLSLVNHYGYTGFPRAPFERLTTQLRTRVQPADAVVHSNKLTFFPAHYYDRSLTQTFIGDEPGSPSDTLAHPTQQALGLFAAPDLETAVRGHERVWLVVFQREIDEYRAAGYETHPHLSWLEEQYALVSVTPFGPLYLYEFQLGEAPGT